MALLPALVLEIAIPVCAVIGIAFSLALWCLRLPINNKMQTASERGRNKKRDLMTSAVYEGAKSFLCKEYRYVGPSVGAFAIVIFLCLGSVEKFSIQSRPCKFDPSSTCKPALATAFFSTFAFLLGAFQAVISGFLGTTIAIYAIKRTALEKTNSIRRTSIAAFRSGAVLGFLLAAISLLVLYLAIHLFRWYYGNDWEGLSDAISGYGLGGSFMALFGRASGGIYAKAADVCRHLVKTKMPTIPEDDRNPAVIPNYVGDIVGNVAGMGPDLFASYAESSCAALVVASISSFGIDHNFTAMCYPLLISSMGILVCLITTLVGEIMPGLKKQLVISTILMTGGISFVSWIALPSSFTIYNFGSQKLVKYWELSLCVSVGLWAGMIIGFVNEIYTKTLSSFHDFAGNIISVSLGSVSIPFFSAVSILVSSRFAGTYGIAVAALGMLSTIATRLAVDAYGPINHHARRNADLSPGEDKYHQRRDACDAAAYATATGKGFPIESAALVSIALFGAFVSSPAMSPGDVLKPKIMIGLIMGAWLPHFFSAMTMKSVGNAVFKMAPDIRNKLNVGLNYIPIHNGPEYYEEFFKISSDASVSGVILPGAIVILAPLFVGTIFGVETLCGVLAGSLSSIVQIAISASNTNEAWRKANKYIRDGARVESGDSWNNTSGKTAKCEETNDDLLKITLSKMIGLVVKTICHLRNDPSGRNAENTETSDALQKETSCTTIDIVEMERNLCVSQKDNPDDIVPREKTTGDSQADTSRENDELAESIDSSQMDTSGSPLNILIQLMAVESLVFAPFFAAHGGLLFKII